MLGRSMGGGVTLNALVAEAGAGQGGGRLRLGQLAVPRQLRPLDPGGAPGRGRGLLRRVRHAARGAGVLPRPVRARVLRPDHRPRCCCTTAPSTTPARSPGRAPPSGCSASAGVRSRLDVYDGEQHAFGPQWPESMRADRRVPAPRAACLTVCSGLSARGPAGLRWRTSHAGERHDRTARRAARPAAGRRARVDRVRRARRRRDPAGPARDPPLLAALRGRRSPDDVTEAPLADESETRRVLAGLAAADRGRAGRGRAPAYRRGRRPGHRDHRRRDPHPLDLRRPGDAPQGRDRQLRGRRPLGRHLGRHQRARPGQPVGRPVDGVQCRALRADRAQLGLLGRARARPGHRPPARRHRPLHHLGPHPPDRPRHRPRDGAADRDRDAAVAGVRRRVADGARPPRARARAVPARHRRRPGSTASGCCSTAARPRSWRCSPCTPRGCRPSSCTRCSTATTR